MKFEKTDIWGFEHALRGMRNPLDSWDKSDSHYRTWEESDEEDEKILNGDYYNIGENDMNLAKRLIKAGSEHRKFLRQIFVSVDITAPFYWWKEFDTYKIGTTANSCSTMHTLAKQPITMDCFEMDDFEDVEIGVTIRYFWNSYLIPALELLRLKYLETKDKGYWKELVRLLPEGWLQKRTVTMNYENLLSICRQRKGHKLTEWKSFINWVKTLPYVDDLLFVE